MGKIKRSNWIVLDITIICLFIILFLFGGVDEKKSLFGSLFFASVGLFFLTSEKMKSKLYLSRVLAWIAENVFKPKTRLNHIFSGLLFIFIGFCMIVSEPITSSEKELFDAIESTPEYWITFILILLFNLLVGVYTARKEKGGNPKI
jgi:hypothetical protein